MRLVVFQDEVLNSNWVTKYIIKNINSTTLNEAFVLGMVMSPFTASVCTNLVKAFKSQQVDFSHVRLFCCSEYCDVSRGYKHSAHSFFFHKFLKHVNIKRENVYILNGTGTNWEEECAQFEQMIENIGPIDLLVGEIGDNGNLFGNEPGSSLNAKTRPKTLAHDTRFALSNRHNEPIEQVPKVMLTIGTSTIMKAKELILCFNGIKHSIPLKHALESHVNNMFPASLLQSHQNVILACDKDSTEELKVQMVNYFETLQQEANLDKV